VIFFFFQFNYICHNKVIITDSKNTFLPNVHKPSLKVLLYDNFNSNSKRSRPRVMSSFKIIYYTSIINRNRNRIIDNKIND